MEFNFDSYVEKFPGFIVEANTLCTLEAKLIRETCTVMGWPFCISNKNNQDLGAVPCGSVDWTREYMKRYGINPPIDPYPEFLHHLLYRHVWFSERWPLDVRCFIKPALREKRFTGFVKMANSYVGKKHKESYWCSTVVEFEKELRLYVANSKILCGFYDPPSRMVPIEPEQFPINDIPEITFPNETWCGTIDLGFLKTGELALVEAHRNPFACGWYGDIAVSNSKFWHLYVGWLQQSWRTMLRLANKK